jgi:polyphosphate glucokinase
MDVLVIDVGGTHVKMCVSGASERRFDSGPELTPEELVRQVRDATQDWTYQAISLGVPGCVGADGLGAEPGNLGPGWVGFDFEQALERPVRIVNDAVMQALGAYDGGRMLFVGLGTGLGTALVTEHVVVPLELGNLPFGTGETMAGRLGREGLEVNGQERWRHDLEEASRVLREAFSADYVVLGGGNAAIADPLPPGTRRGGNEDAFTGGYRLWEEMVEPHDRQPPAVWRVVR